MFLHHSTVAWSTWKTFLTKCSRRKWPVMALLSTQRVRLRSPRCLVRWPNCFLVGAFGLVCDNGVELIVHIGLDTIELRGEGFENIASEGQVVQAGTPIVRFDRAAIERKGKVILSPVVSCGNGTIVRRASGQVQAGRDVLFVLQV
jgi:hypothetical protein